MFTLVPSSFFDPLRAREALLSVCPGAEGEKVEYVEIPDYMAVLVYSVPQDGPSSVPVIKELLDELHSCPEYNKILCSVSDGVLYLAIGQGNNLLLANSYPAPDFTTAQYFIFLAMKTLQLNPEVSSICWKSPLSARDEISLGRYFKSVEFI